MTSLSALILGAMLPANLGSQSLALGQEHFISTARYRNHILCLQEGGRVRVRSLGAGSRDRELSAALSREGLIHIASDGTSLWAASPAALHHWSPSDENWDDATPIIGRKEHLTALAVFNGKPLLLFSHPGRVLLPMDRRTIHVPSNLYDLPLRVLALHPSEETLWIGAGYGEWGGCLLGYNPRSGRWVAYRDPVHYVTGITRARPGELIVSWSMHHFSAADTLIREHRDDARPSVSFPHMRQAYYQKIAYSHPDRILYGFDRDELASICQGRPTPLAVLKGLGFDREPRAIGVAPGVLELFPVAPGRLYIATMFNGLWMLKDEELVPVWMP